MKKILNIVSIISMASIVVLMLLICADVFMRLLFDKPIVGAVEVAQIIMVCIFPIVAVAAYDERHIKVDTIYEMLPKKIQMITDYIVLIASIAMCVFLAWQSYNAALFSKSFNKVYSQLRLPEYPFKYLFAITMLALAIVLIHKFIVKLRNKEAV